jgi:hypothetical protein
VLAVAVMGGHVLVEWAGRAAFGLAGVAVGMAVTTCVVLVALLVPLRAVERSVAGILTAAAVLGGLAAVTFAAPTILLGPVAAAAVGLALFAGGLAAWRPPGLRRAWAYVHTLQ